MNGYSFEIILKNDKVNPNYFVIDFNKNYYVVGFFNEKFKMSSIEPYFEGDEEVNDSKRFEKMIATLGRFCEYYPVNEADLSKPDNIKIFDLAQQNLT